MGFRFNQGDRPIPGYTIQRGVGRGGFGEVYYATSDGGKEVAVKYLRENPQVELRGVSHCLNLKSPYLVSLHDIKQNQDGEFFVIMEYVNGPSLRDLLNAETNGLGVQKAAYLIREIGKGLAYLHDCGIVHRDLKPGNIFYEDGYVKIGDYGLAKIMTASQHSGQTVSVGTVHYMAPEVGSGNYDRTIDIYALGVILYEMLLGRVPFTGQTMGEVLMKHLTAQPEVDELPDPFPKVIRKALAKDPADRYQTVAEMMAELFSVDALDRSVAGFEPASLSTVAARAVRHADAVGAATVAAGGAAAVGSGSSNVGQSIPPPIINPTPVGKPDRFGGIPNRIGVRIERLAERIDNTAIGREVAASAVRATGRVERVLVALLVTAGIAFGAGLLRGGDEFGNAVGTFLFSGVLTTSSLLGCWLGFQRLHLRGKWMPRLLIAAATGIGGAILAEGLRNQWGWSRSELSGGTAVLLVTALLADWPRRFHKGRSGQVRLGEAFSAGLLAGVLGLMWSDGNALLMAAVAAAASLSVQTLAVLWPNAVGGVNWKPETARPVAAPVVGGRAGPPPPPVVVTPPPIEDPAGTPPRVDEARSRTQGIPPPLPPPAATRGAEKGRALRSPAVRSLWLLAAALLLGSGILTFAAPSFMSTDPGDEAGFYTFGTVLMCYFVFALSRAIPRYHAGLWRGVFRPGIFFTGIASSAAAGVAWGNFNLGGEGEFIALIFIILGAVVSLFVWFVPVPPYQPAAEETRPGDDSQGRWVTLVGWMLLAAMFALMGVIMGTVPEYEWDKALPATMVPLGGLGLGLLVVGYVKNSRSRPRPAEPRKLSLPLRVTFEVDANANLSKLIERHLAMLGYALTGRSDLLWTFTRGHWGHQFWHEDIRRWRTELKIAAYELDTGGYRLSCYLNVDTVFNEPSQKMIQALTVELNDLRELLGGREVPSAAAGEVA